MLPGADVVVSNVGEHTVIKRNSITPVLFFRLRGNLHHNMGAALPHHFRKQLLQHNRLRRCIF